MTTGIVARHVEGLDQQIEKLEQEFAETGEESYFWESKILTEQARVAHTAKRVSFHTDRDLEEVVDEIAEGAKKLWKSGVYNDWTTEGKDR